VPGRTPASEFILDLIGEFAACGLISAALCRQAERIFYAAFGSQEGNAHASSALASPAAPSARELPRGVVEFVYSDMIERP